MGHVLGGKYPRWEFPRVGKTGGGVDAQKGKDLEPVFPWRLIGLYTLQVPTIKTALLYVLIGSHGCHI